MKWENSLLPAWSTSPENTYFSPFTYKYGNPEIIRASTLLSGVENLSEITQHSVRIQNSVCFWELVPVVSGSAFYIECLAQFSDVGEELLARGLAFVRIQVIFLVLPLNQVNSRYSCLLQSQKLRSSSELLNIRQRSSWGGARSELPRLPWNYVVQTVTVLVVLFWVILVLFFFVWLILIVIFFLFFILLVLVLFVLFF